MPDIRIAAESDHAVWDAFVQEQPSAGPYHAFAWKTAVETAYGHRAMYLIAENPAGDIAGVLPLTLIKPPLMKGTLVSQPFCDYGGVLAQDENAAALLVEKARELAHSHRAKLEIRCKEAEPCLEDSPDFSVSSHKARMVLDLPGSGETLWKSLKAKVRSQVRRPTKDGMVFKLGAANLADDFYSVFARNMRELGSPVHAKTWIGAVLEVFGDRARAGIVYKEQTPVAGGIILKSGGTVSIPWASALSEYKKSSPNMLLYWGFLEHAADAGAEQFDFGRSTPDEGTYRFKAQWGAKPEPLFWYSTRKTGAARSESSRTSGNTKRELAAEVWRRLPLALTNTIGPVLRKYISL